MDPRALIRITLATGIIAAIGGIGCSLIKGEDAASSPDEVNSAGDTSEVLKSTLQLQGGCTAAKVGPKQLLVAARCVSGNALFVAGKTISFTTAASGTIPKIVAASDAGDAGSVTPAPIDSGATDSGGYDSGSVDSGSAPVTNPNARVVTIADVKIHPSYVAKCTGDLCDFNKIAASDSPDIAVIILDQELDTIPTVPVDLDPVSPADELLEVSSGCATFDAKPTAKQKVVSAEAVNPKSVNHAGSPYASQPQLVTRLGSTYVVTAAAGWKTGAPRLCKSDIGAPLFRGDMAAVAGVTSNFTTYAASRVPVTTHHTRVDTASRFKIGDWLKTLGAETIHSCSESTAGCVKKTSDAGEPPGPSTDGTTDPGDAGSRPDAKTPVPPQGDAAPEDDGAAPPASNDPPPGDDTPHQDTLPGEEPSSGPTGGGEEADAAAGGKKKKKDEGGCSAAPGGTSSTPSGGFVIGLALALGAIIARRKKS
jgi:hypothetical protein